jgi:hypothetical protein
MALIPFIAACGGGGGGAGEPILTTPAKTIATQETAENGQESGTGDVTSQVGGTNPTPDPSPVVEGNSGNLTDPDPQPSVSPQTGTDITSGPQTGQTTTTAPITEPTTKPTTEPVIEPTTGTGTEGGEIVVIEPPTVITPPTPAPTPTPVEPETETKTSYEKLHNLTASTSNLFALFEKNVTDLIPSAAHYDAQSQVITHLAESNLTDILVLSGLDYVGSVSFVKDGHSYTGFIGIPTAEGDMPNGTFTYQGAASAVIKSAIGNGIEDLSNGVTTITMTTADGPSLTAQMIFAGDASIDTIVFNTTDINGSGFQGGTLTTSKNGEAVVILRDGDKIVSQGQFFGPDAVNVAGQILATAGGGDNSINAIFYVVKD